MMFKFFAFKSLFGLLSFDIQMNQVRVFRVFLSSAHYTDSFQVELPNRVILPLAFTMLVPGIIVLFFSTPKASSFLVTR